MVLWKGDGNKERDFPALSEIGLSVAASSDRQRLLVGDLAGKLSIFNIEKGEMVGTPDTNPPRLEERLKVAESAAHDIAALEKSVSEKVRVSTETMQVAASRKRKKRNYSRNH